MARKTAQKRQRRRSRRPEADLEKTHMLRR